MPISSHPKSLPYLFLTEMWERFGFYVVQGFLVLYMTGHFGFNDDEAYIITGMFSALVYIAPLIGGHAADRYLGFRSAVVLGGVLLILGYALLGFSASETVFLSALGVIITGNGLFKPNISSLLGMQYPEGNLRRVSGFTLFYVGINLGAFLAGPISGYLKEAFGWRVSFSFAAIGMLVGLGIFVSGWKLYRDIHSRERMPLSFLIKLMMVLGVAVTTAIVLMHFYHYSKYVLPFLALCLVTYLVILIRKHQAEERTNLILICMLTLSSIVFWSMMLQIFFSINLYIDRLVDKSWFGLTLPTTAFYSVEGLYLIIFGPVFAWMWDRFAQNAVYFNPLYKFVLAIFFTASAFIILAISTYFPDHALQISAHWIFLAYFLIIIGELLLSPVGLSAITTLAPRHIAGFLMGVWFTSMGFGGSLAGWLATFASVPAASPPLMQLMIYRQAFWGYAGFALGIAGLFFWLARFVSKNTTETNIH